jgi:hypothetical protein
MSVLGGSSVFTNRAPIRAEYSLYVNVSDTPSPFNESVQPLTERHLIDQSDCIYQRIWDDAVHPHFKAGLLFCHDGVNIERGQGQRHDNIRNRTMFLILCETGIRHFEGRNKKWVEYIEDMTPGNYIYLTWNFDHLFTTTDGKSIQLKVVDAHPDAAQQTSAVKKRPSAGVGHEQLAEMKTLLHQMKLSEFYE